MAAGKAFNLTPKRQELAIEHFKAQGSLNALAIHFRITSKVLSAHLKKHKIDFKALQLSGINTLKADMYKAIYNQKSPKDTFNAGMQYLNKYDTDGNANTTDTTNNDTQIRLEIIKDLAE
jgi:DNA polymerase II large subunit